MIKNLKVGTRIFYGGDIANPQGFGTITEVKPATEYRSESVIIKFDDGRKTDIETFHFSDEYKGNDSTRFVTLEAYKKYREDFMRKIKEANKKFKS